MLFDTHAHLDDEQFDQNREEVIQRALDAEVTSMVAVGTTALIFQMLAIQVVLVGLVETFKRGLGCVAAVVAGRWFFGEPITLPKTLAVLFMAVGVALILL